MSGSRFLWAFSVLTLVPQMPSLWRLISFKAKMSVLVQALLVIAMLKLKIDTEKVRVSLLDMFE